MQGYFESPFKRYFHHSTSSSASSLSDSTTSIPSHNASQVLLDQIDEYQTADDEKEVQSNVEKPLNKKNEEILKVVSMADILKNPKELEHFKVRFHNHV